MTEPLTTGKWMETESADTPCIVAARRVLRRRLSSVDRLLRLASNPTDDPQPVHQLRVAARRSEGALKLFEGFSRVRRSQRLRRALRRIRRGASAARQIDVHRLLLGNDLLSCDESMRPAFEFALAQLEESRQPSVRKLSSLRQKYGRLGRRKHIRRLVPSGDAGCAGIVTTAGTAGSPYVLGTLATGELPSLIAELVSHQHDAFSDPDKMHEFRVTGKRLRYALEIFAGCFPARLREHLYPCLADMLDRLGEMNDLSEVALRLEMLAAVAPDHPNSNGAAVHPKNAVQVGLARLAGDYRTQREARHHQFVQWWNSTDAQETIGELADLLSRQVRRPATVRSPQSCSSNSGAMVRSGTDSLKPARSDEALPTHRRVAAIDLGTNSLRLVVGEVDPLTHYRIIEELKETTRLGSGVFRDGRMTASSMESSLEALQRMKKVAEACRVDRIRAVATSAVREAVNRAEFLEAVERQTGIRVEVISAEREARLAFSSVANAFDLDDRRVAVVDIGGGSTELILSSGGVIDVIHPLPLGAVRLAEQFFRHDRSEEAYDEMRRAVDHVIDDRMADSSYQPFLMIGTGGTFTSLARVALRHGIQADGVARNIPAVRGYEMLHSEVLYFLDQFRRMTLEERRKVAGLSAQRAEIIISGVCIVERLMGRLGVSRVRIHDGGIREGLLAETIDELGVSPAPPRRRKVGSIDAVRRFAERCRYDQAHSEHVAKLALRLFDQLAELRRDSLGFWRQDEARHLLQAAGILHDVGIAISWARHHRHSFDMVMNADIPGYSRRDIEVIANLCRYHRRGGPKLKHVHFQRLGDDDQRLVRHLVGILRIADGLDRLHDQMVTDVTVDCSPDSVIFEVTANVAPESNLRYAKRKADLFEAAFQTRTRFRWLGTTEGTVDEAPPAEEAEVPA